MQYLWEYSSDECGKLEMYSDGKVLTSLGFAKHNRGEVCEKKEKEYLPVFQCTCEWLDCYFSKRVPDFLPQMSANGTPFQKMIWKMLLEIPYGKLVTYGDLAKRAAREMGKEKMSAQAVGGAVGRNPIAIIIPCHRVVGAGGNLTGYAGGLDKKIELLRVEGVDMSKLYLPPAR